MKPADLAHLEATARRIGKVIGGGLPPGIGFVLWLFSFEPGWATYLSNAQRDTMIEAVEEMLAVLKRGGDQPPGKTP